MAIIAFLVSTLFRRLPSNTAKSVFSLATSLWSVLLTGFLLEKEERFDLTIALSEDVSILVVSSFDDKSFSDPLCLASRLFKAQTHSTTAPIDSASASLRGHSRTKELR